MDKNVIDKSTLSADERHQLDDLLKARFPRIFFKNIPMRTTSNKTANLTMTYGIALEPYIDDSGNMPSDDMVIPVLQVTEETRGVSKTTDFETAKIMDVLDGTVTIDEFCQDNELVGIIGPVMETIIMDMQDLDFNAFSAEFMQEHSTIENYIDQQQRIEAADISRVMFNKAFPRPEGPVRFPREFIVNRPSGYVPDKQVMKSITGYLAEGAPAIAVIGPTGAGKSLTARAIAHMMNARGVATLKLDANERTEGDRLFDRDDFNSDGTFIHEGVLIRAARRTREMNKHLVVIVDEFNTYSDTVRREFYPLFDSDPNQRVYHINSAKYAGGVGEVIPFDHVQFLLTGNPITSARYLTDDIRPFSNAEARRLKFVYQDYSKDPQQVKAILKSVIENKPIVAEMVQVYPTLLEDIDWSKGIDCFLELTRSDDHGNSLGFDVGYTPVADWLWTGTIRSATESTAWVTSSLENLIYPVPDHAVREDIANRLNAKLNIVIPETEIYRDA